MTTSDIELKELLSREGNRSLCPMAVIVRDNRVLLGRRNYTAETWKDISVWTTPGGRCEQGESIETTLRREVKEETGITDLHIHSFLGSVNGARETDTIMLFACSSAEEARLMEPEKFSEWQWFDVETYVSEDLGSFNREGARLIVAHLKSFQSK